MTRPIRLVTDIKYTKHQLLSLFLAKICEGYSLLPKEVRPFFDPKVSKYKAKRLYVIDEEVQGFESTPLDKISDSDWVLYLDMTSSDSPSDRGEFREYIVDFYLLVVKAEFLTIDQETNTVDFDGDAFDHDSAVENPKMFRLGLNLGLNLVQSIAADLPDDKSSERQHGLMVHELSVAEALQGKNVMSVVMGHLFKLFHDYFGPMDVKTIAIHIGTASLLCTSDEEQALMKKVYEADGKDEDYLDDEGVPSYPWEHKPLAEVVKHREPKLPGYYLRSAGVMLMPPPRNVSASAGAGTMPAASRSIPGVPARRVPWSEEAADYILNCVGSKPLL
ncbi:MAG: hypothetical protein P1U40_04940 [Coxiellaceae bacterium]|nr:hypothetical protein [Coxiellaceae bacterium]